METILVIVDADFNKRKRKRPDVEYRDVIHPQVREAVYGFCGFRCVYCGITREQINATQIPGGPIPDLWLDHVIPYNIIQNNDPLNLVASCEECNLRKGSRKYETFHQAITHVRNKINSRGRRGCASPITVESLRDLPQELPAQAQLAKVLQRSLPDYSVLQASSHYPQLTNNRRGDKRSSYWDGSRPLVTSVKIG